MAFRVVDDMLQDVRVHQVVLEQLVLRHFLLQSCENFYSHAFVLVSDAYPKQGKQNLFHLVLRYCRVLLRIQIKGRLGSGRSHSARAPLQILFKHFLFHELAYKILKLFAELEKRERFDSSNFIFLRLEVGELFHPVEKWFHFLILSVAHHFPTALSESFRDKNY